MELWTRKRKTLSLTDRAAKRTFLLLGLHAAAFVAALESDKEHMWLQIILLTAYALCMASLDRTLWQLKSRSAARTLCRYWMAAALCVGAWMLWGERWMSSSGDFLKLLVCFDVVPYISVFSVNYQGWPWHNGRLCSTLGISVLLLLCLTHIGMYGYLRCRGSEE